MWWHWCVWGVWTREFSAVSVLDSIQVEEAFSALDMDANGVLSPAEFSHVRSILKAMASPKESAAECLRSIGTAKDFGSGDCAVPPELEMPRDFLFLWSNCSGIVGTEHYARLACVLPLRLGVELLVAMVTSTNIPEAVGKARDSGAISAPCSESSSARCAGVSGSREMWSNGTNCSQATHLLP